MNNQGALATPRIDTETEYSIVSRELDSAITELIRSLAELNGRLAPVKFQEARPEPQPTLKNPRETAPMSPLGLFLSEQMSRIHQLQSLVRTNLDDLRI